MYQANVNISLTNCTVDVDAKEGHNHVPEINNILEFRKYTENSLICIKQASAAGMTIEDTPS